jgi:protein-S-isoprenylcysteine O-methyltransferase Ste14
MNLMLAWINFAILIVATLLTLVFYVLSAGPAALEKKIGPRAYQKCARYRMLSGLFMFVASANYVLYVFYPLPISLAQTFPWPWWVSILIALLIAIPSGYLWVRGMQDAGEETMLPKKEHTMYGGIYQKIRHPQAVGELPFWWVFAFLCHSPFLVLYSFVWVPIFVIMCWAEERDLVQRYGKAYQEYRQRTGAFFPKQI